MTYFPVGCPTTAAKAGDEDLLLGLWALLPPIVFEMTAVSLSKPACSVAFTEWVASVVALAAWIASKLFERNVMSNLGSADGTAGILGVLRLYQS